MSETAPELHLFIIWEKARYLNNKILESLEKDFEIIDIKSIRWSDNYFSDNLSRFYGTALPPGSLKEKTTGKGDFLLIIIRDYNPLYGERKTSKGFKTVNTKVFDKKILFRSWDNNLSSIHASNTQEEFSHDINILLNKDQVSELTGNKYIWDSGVISLEQDICGASGWKNIRELFDFLNRTCKYIVLRNFENLPEHYYLEEHNDIDIYCENTIETAFLCNAGKVYQEEYRVHYSVIIDNKKVYFDFRSPDDNYYCPEMGKYLLNRRIFSEKGFYIPDQEAYFYSLLYHAIVHKAVFRDDYSSRLIKIAGEISSIPEITENTNFKEYLKILNQFLLNSNYYYQLANDYSVSFNRRILYIVNNPYLFSPEVLFLWLETHKLYYLVLNYSAELLLLNEKTENQSIEILCLKNDYQKIVNIFQKKSISINFQKYNKSSGKVKVNFYNPENFYTSKDFSEKLLIGRRKKYFFYVPAESEEIIFQIVYSLFKGSFQNYYNHLYEKFMNRSSGSKIKISELYKRLSEKNVISKVFYPKSSLLPYLHNFDKCLYSSYLTEYKNKKYQSMIYLPDNKTIQKQTTGKLAIREYHFLKELQGFEYFPKAFSFSDSLTYSMVEMEYIVNSKSLEESQGFIQKLPYRLIKSFISDCLNILEILSEKAIIHRDINLSNILINRKLKPLLIDFGWAVKSGEKVQYIPGLGGQGLCPDKTYSDIYAMGIVFKNLFNGYPEIKELIRAMTEYFPSQRLSDISSLKKLLDNDY